MGVEKSELKFVRYIDVQACVSWCVLAYVWVCGCVLEYVWVYVRVCVYVGVRMGV